MVEVLLVLQVLYAGCQSPQLGASVDTLFIGEVQTVEFPALSLKVMVQVLPWAAPVVHSRLPATSPEPPASAKPTRLKVVPPSVLLCHGPCAGSQVPQTGTVLSTLKTPVVVATLPALSRAQTNRVVPPDGALVVVPPLVITLPPVVQAAFIALVPQLKRISARPEAGSDAVITLFLLVLNQVLLALVIFNVGAAISILFCGEVQVVELPALSVIVTLQVALWVADAVQANEVAEIPLPPASVLPVRVKSWVAAVVFQGTGDAGDQEVPQTGAVKSTLKVPVVVVTFPALSLVQTKRLVPPAGALLVACPLVLVVPPASQAAFMALVPQLYLI